MKSVLRYPGGKSRAVKLLQNYLPSELNELVSPFFGGGSFELFCLSEYNTTIYGADIFKPLVYFWQRAVNDNVQLIERVSTFLPAVTREQYYQMQGDMESLEDTLDIAAYFFVLNRCSFSGNIAGGFTSYHMGVTGQNPRFNQASVDRLIDCKHLKDKLIINLATFKETLDTFSSSIFTYLDPPYLIKNKIYGVRGDATHNIDHVLLLDLLKERKGPWLLSYNNCDIIKDMYKEYYIIEDIFWDYGMSKNKTSKELLILSPELEKLYNKRLGKQE